MNSDLVELVEYSFPSVWALELLLLLRRHSGQHWRPDELVGELRSSDAVVAESIDRLLAAGLVLVQEDGAVLYAPASEAQDALLRQLEEEYRKRPAAIRRLIVQRPAEKLRSFSDAFKLKRDD